MADLHATLAENVAAGRKSLVVYLTGGLPDLPTTTRLVEAAAAAGADAVELGIPFSDPVMDGPVIQAASQLSLSAGTTPTDVFAAAKPVAGGFPVGFMTYANIVHHAGWERFAADAKAAGLCAGIIPDVPLEEAGPWLEAARAAGIDPVLLVAPTTPTERIARIAAAGRGFLYCVGVLGVTGERESLADSATQLAARAKEVSGLPVLIGVGVSTPEQAAEACRVADGVVVGSAVVRRVLEAASPDAAVDAVGELVGAIRAALS